jgi:chemotaxis protein methyltransferase CheR
VIFSPQPHFALKETGLHESITIRSPKKFIVPISEKTFSQLTKLISDLAGIQLAENRKKMLANRISTRLSALKLRTFEEYNEFVSSDTAGTERQELIEAITTHYTSFFRDEGQFAHVREELTKTFKERRNKVRIWSTACSSGEEPYSLAIVALEAAAQAGAGTPDIRILATDISNQVLRQAYEGWFPVSSLQKLSIQQRAFFEPTPQHCEVSGDVMLRVNKQLRDLVIFRNVNLCEHPLQVPGEIDIIFCRNVLLYFNSKMQQLTIGSVADKLKIGGLLYVGASEQVRGFLPGMVTERESVFRKTAVSPGTLVTPEYLCNSSSVPALALSHQRLD